MKKQYLTLLVFSLLILGALFVGGCGETSNKETSEEKQPEATKVTTIGQVSISAANWDADPEVDGLSFWLQPKDAESNLVKTDGKISAKLWKLECTEMSQIGCVERKCTKKEKDLIETWNDVAVTKKDYDIIRAVVKLEYKNYTPQGDDYEIGCVEVVFTTPDGKSFISLDDYVILNKGY